MDEPPLLEVFAARCKRCGDAVDPEELSGGRFTDWPVVVEADAAPPPTHGRCGGRLLLEDVRPFGHVCAEGCECLSGGLPERAI